MNEQRQNYLTQFWKPYPASQGGLCGRILKISALGVELLGQVFPFDSLSLRSNASMRAEDVLKAGDIVEIISQLGRYQLEILAPNLLATELSVTVSSHKINPKFDQWMLFKNSVRQYFLEKNFKEMETPFLVSCPGTEPFLDPLPVDIQIGSEKLKKFLPTSPELHLKKCLAMGYQQLFEIKTCFRDAEVSNHHQIEFAMLEWYRAYTNLSAIQIDILELISFLQPQSEIKKQIVHKTLKQLFQEFLNFELRPNTSREELAQLASGLDLKFSADFDFDDLFGLIFVDKIEAKLANYPYLFLSDYPPSQAALARLTDEGWGDRFEFYIAGVEIANAFHELNDPTVQRQRSLADLAHKKRLKKSPVGLDEDFFLALESGLPPSAGVALGLERLFLVLNGFKDLSDFRLFPLRLT